MAFPLSSLAVYFWKHGQNTICKQYNPLMNIGFLSIKIANVTMTPILGYLQEIRVIINIPDICIDESTI